MLPKKSQWMTNERRTILLWILLLVAEAEETDIGETLGGMSAIFTEQACALEAGCTPLTPAPAPLEVACGKVVVDGNWMFEKLGMAGETIC
jgi:hypothetical protein